MNKTQEEPSYGAPLKALLDLLGERVRSASKAAPLVRKESLKSVLLLSDMFLSKAAYEWMLMTFLEVIRSSSAEDPLLMQYAVVGVCKAVAALKSDSANYSHEIVAAIDRSLKSEHSSLSVSALHGVLYLLEARSTLVFSVFFSSSFSSSSRSLNITICFC